MFRTGFSGRLSGWGSAAKVAVATTAAALTLTAAVAAAVVLPAGGGDEAAAVLRGANLQAGPVDTGGPTTSVAPEVHVGGEASVPTPTGAASARADAGTGSGPAGATPSTPLRSIPIPSIPIPSGPDFGGALPELSSLTDIPTKVMGCLAPIYDLVSSMPSTPSMEQLMQIGPTVVSCVTAIVADLPLPSGMNACIAEIMGFVSDMTSNLPTGVPAIGDLNVAACIPSGLPVPTGFSGFTGGGLPFRR